MGGEKEPYRSNGVLADLTRPAKKPLAIPLQVNLVVWRHMLLHCAVLIGAAIQAQMGSNASPRKEYLHGSPGKTHIHLLLDIFIRYGIVHALHADMVVVLDSGNLPDSQLEGSCWKRLQKELLLGKA